MNLKTLLVALGVAFLIEMTIGIYGEARRPSSFIDTKGRS